LLPALRLGDDLSLVGTALARSGTLSALFSNDRLGLVNTLPLTPGASANELRAHLPSTTEQPAAMAAWASGAYGVVVRVDEPGQPSWTTNSVPVAIAPRISASPLAATAGSAFTLTVTCSPRLHPLQEPGVRLLLGSTELLPATLATPADTSLPSTLTFQVGSLSAGDYLLRLRVDGIDSLPILATGSPPVLGFDAAQKLVVS
jgi:hypothetical protein